MEHGTYFYLINRTLPNSVGVRNYSCTQGTVLLDIMHCESDRQFATLLPSEARIIAQALIAAADELDQLNIKPVKVG